MLYPDTIGITLLNKTVCRKLQTIFFQHLTLFTMPFVQSQPKILKRALNPIEPCMSRGILVLRKQKNHLSYTCLKSPTPANVFSFKKYRNLYNQIIRCAKKIYFEKQLKENQKKLAENMANSFLCDSQR